MATRVASISRAQIPNGLTVARLALVPAFVVLALHMDGRASLAAAAVFGAAAITDQVDGWLARRWQVESGFGRVVDPLADRLMIDAAVVLLWLDGRLPWPGLVLILARDAILLSFLRLSRSSGYELSVSFLGKAATWILYASLVAVLLTDGGRSWPLALFWTGLALAVAAGALYGAAAWRALGAPGR